jgi:hypothetical protein
MCLIYSKYKAETLRCDVTGLGHPSCLWASPDMVWEYLYQLDLPKVDLVQSFICGQTKVLDGVSQWDVQT